MKPQPLANHAQAAARAWHGRRGSSLCGASARRVLFFSASGPRRCRCQGRARCRWPSPTCSRREPCHAASGSRRAERASSRALLPCEAHAPQCVPLLLRREGYSMPAIFNTMFNFSSKKATSFCDAVCFGSTVSLNGGSANLEKPTTFGKTLRGCRRPGRSRPEGVGLPRHPRCASFG